MRKRLLEIVTDILFAAGDAVSWAHWVPGYWRLSQRVLYPAAWYLDEKAGRMA